MAKPHFRSPTALQMIDQRVYRGIYAGSPNAYLVLTPDLKIVNGNDSFVKVARVSREVFAGKFMFDAFPGNTEEENTGVRELLASFDRVLASKQSDTLNTQRYDVQNSRGIWETRHWDGTSWAILDDKQSITALILHVNEIVQSDEVTQMVQFAEAQLRASRKLADKVEELVRSIRNGGSDKIQVLRDLLRQAPTLH